MSEKEVKHFLALELRAASGEAEGRISGYASTYAKDAYGDRIAPGAFADSISEKRGKYPILFGHEPNALIGFSTHMAEDHKGLQMEAKLAMGTTAARDAFSLIQTAESVDFRMGLSIGFRTEQFEMVDDVRVLTQIDLMEVSLTAFPANRFAQVTDARSIRKSRVSTADQLRAAIREAGLRPIYR